MPSNDASSYPNRVASGVRSVDRFGGRVPGTTPGWRANTRGGSTIRREGRAPGMAPLGALATAGPAIAHAGGIAPSAGTAPAGAAGVPGAAASVESVSVTDGSVTG